MYFYYLYFFLLAKYIGWKWVKPSPTYARPSQACSLVVDLLPFIRFLRIFKVYVPFLSLRREEGVKLWSPTDKG